MSDNNININTPDIGPYTQLKPFRFWCQKVLPLVYDESLSYYELLCKVVDYLNKTMEDVDQMITDMGEFQTADRDFKTDMVDRFIAFTRGVDQTLIRLEDYIDNYFNNLNVQTEINNKLDAMAEAGYFDTLFTTLFTDDIITEAGNVTSAWIAENLLQETGYVIDKSLTVENAAADAEATGDAVNTLKRALYDTEKLTIIEYTPGYYVRSAAVGDTLDPSNLIASNDYRYAILECAEGDKFTLSIYGGGEYTQGWVFTDENYVVLELSSSSINVDNYILTAPENAAFLVLNDKSGKQSYIGKANITTAEENINAIYEKINDNTPLNYYKEFVFQNGVYASIGNYASAINGTPTRIYGEIVLANPAYNISIEPTDSNYNFEYAFFDRSNTKLISNSTWNTQKITFESELAIKTVRIDIRRSNNANIAPTANTGIVIAVNDALNLKAVNASLSKAFKEITYNNSFVRLNVMTHNVGKFNYGNSGGYAGPDVQAKLLEWKNMYGKYQPDFLLGQENVLWFDSDHTISPAQALFAPIFPYYYGNGDYATFIRSKIPFKQTFDIPLSVVVSDVTYTRTATCGLINISGKDILLVSTHLSPGYTADAETARELQAQALITALEDYDTIIIGGDFNSSNDSFFELFTDEGYTCVNHGYWGTLETLNNESIDNIITKGWAPYNILCSQNDACTSDHYPLVSKLALI